MSRKKSLDVEGTLHASGALFNVLIEGSDGRLRLTVTRGLKPPVAPYLLRECIRVLRTNRRAARAALAILRHGRITTEVVVGKRKVLTVAPESSSLLGAITGFPGLQLSFSKTS